MSGGKLALAMALLLKVFIQVATRMYLTYSTPCTESTSRSRSFLQLELQGTTASAIWKRQPMLRNAHARRGITRAAALTCLAMVHPTLPLIGDEATLSVLGDHVTTRLGFLGSSMTPYPCPPSPTSVSAMIGARCARGVQWSACPLIRSNACGSTPGMFHARTSMTS